MTAAEKAAKEKLENPTVDANGEHIQTVEEAKLEARAMQAAAKLLSNLDLHPLKWSHLNARLGVAALEAATSPRCHVVTKNMQVQAP
jgi:hypothetical protein